MKNIIVKSIVKDNQILGYIIWKRVSFFRYEKITEFVIV